jgi:hypothetical protein
VSYFKGTTAATHRFFYRTVKSIAFRNLSQNILNRFFFFYVLKMTFLTSWEDFEKAAERLYLQDPTKVSSKN